MGADNLRVIPARRGLAVRLAKGEHLKVINTHGQQVVDTWAFNAADAHEFMSMEHTRTTLAKVNPQKGDFLYTNRRRPIVTLVEDTSPGVHDTLLAACDVHRYHLLGHRGHHDNCTDNLRNAMHQLDAALPEVPCPLNLFMNIPVAADGRISFQSPVSRPGDFVVLRADLDCVVVFSACPQDMVPINGRSCTPTDAHCAILPQAD